MNYEKRRERMIVALPPEIRLAVKLRAIKLKVKTGDVVAEAIRATFPAEIAEAEQNKAAATHEKTSVR